MGFFEKYGAIFTRKEIMLCFLKMQFKPRKRVIFIRIGKIYTQEINSESPTSRYQWYMFLDCILFILKKNQTLSGDKVLSSICLH